MPTIDSAWQQTRWYGIHFYGQRRTKWCCVPNYISFNKQHLLPTDNFMCKSLCALLMVTFVYIFFISLLNSDHNCVKHFNSLQCFDSCSPQSSALVDIALHVCSLQSFDNIPCPFVYRLCPTFDCYYRSVSALHYASDAIPLLCKLFFVCMRH